VVVSTQFVGSDLSGTQFRSPFFLFNEIERPNVSQLPRHLVFTTMTVSIDSGTSILTPAQLRQQCRNNQFEGKGTAGLCPGYTQANLIILPAEYADDFRLLCKRNPVPCPLIGETRVGDPTIPEHLVGSGSSDVRTDLARYSVYENGELVDQKMDITEEWREDSVAFFIGCSHSFEGALEEGGLELRHHTLKKIVPCYRSEVRLLPAGRESSLFPGGFIRISCSQASRDEWSSRCAHSSPLNSSEPASSQPPLWGLMVSRSRTDSTGQLSSASPISRERIQHGVIQQKWKRVKNRSTGDAE
jgi:uncharacterized protein YcsI (UPF0317 family)